MTQVSPRIEQTRQPQIRKAATGISGLDDITFGGLPAGRPTLVVGAAGCGKTLLAMTFLINGTTRFDEAGVIMSFEETGDEIAANVASLNFDVPGLIAAKKLAIDYVRIERSEIEETGEYDLEGLFVRLDHAASRWGRSAWSWIRSRPCSPGCRTPPSFVPNFAGYSPG